MFDYPCSQKDNYYGLNILSNNTKSELQLPFTHYGEIAEGLVASGESKLVCYGHSHTFAEKQMGKTLLLKPGEIMGKEGLPGFCLLDTATLEVKRVELPGFC